MPKTQLEGLKSPPQILKKRNAEYKEIHTEVQDQTITAFHEYITSKDLNSVCKLMLDITENIYYDIIYHDEAWR